MKWIADRLVTAGIARHRQIVGYSERELLLLEEELGFQIPRAYREFLRAMGHGAGNLFCDGEAFFHSAEEFRIQREILHDSIQNLGSTFLLPNTSLVIYSHQGYLFDFLLADAGSDDPEVLTHVEGSEPCVRYRCFSAFLEDAVSRAERRKSGW